MSHGSGSGSKEGQGVLLCSLSLTQDKMCVVANSLRAGSRAIAPRHGLFFTRCFVEGVNVSDLDR